MDKAFLGIDLGTSSVKVLCLRPDGSTNKVWVGYEKPDIEGWRKAVFAALSQLDTSGVAAVGLSAQTGTYIVNDHDVIAWNTEVGSKELQEIQERYPKEIFLKELGMAHPSLVSYPIPRLLYIKRKYGNGAKVCQPKEMLVQLFTGRIAADPYTWRGLANPKTGRYSDFFLRELGNPMLPKLCPFTSCVGTVTQEMQKETGLCAGIPVYCGLNDFYASLVGMGAVHPGDLFDITGTSEHLGMIESALAADTPLISSAFLDSFVQYGVTGASGTSLGFGRQCFQTELTALSEDLVRTAPIFTPYLTGERAPIFDSAASGTLLGITQACKKEHLAYSVLEGVVFSLFHIYETMGKPIAARILVSGGAAKNRMLNFLKSEMFALPLATIKENDSSALGAAVTAAVGRKAYADIAEAVRIFCRTEEQIAPEGRLRPLLDRRYQIYKKIYPALKEQYMALKEVRQ